MAQVETGPRPNPTFNQQVWNFASSVAAFVADGCHLVTKEQYQSRLEICSSCEDRRGGACSRCGCNLALKAQGRAFACPIAKWGAYPESAPANTA